MPRQPRLDLAGVAQHIVQRGNDRRPCFFEDIDHVRYPDELREIGLREGCAVHAYALMTNHVDLLVTPSAQGQIARMMQSPGRRYVRYVNDRYRRTGTLWEGRYKACLVDSEAYLLRCYRYIELNPLRACTVADPLIRPHLSYLRLGAKVAERCSAYRMPVEQAITPDELDGIRLHLQRQHAYGTERFRAAIEAQPSRRAGPARIGRPRKSTLSPESAH